MVLSSIQFLPTLFQLIGLGSPVLFGLGFWKLWRLTETRIARTGLVASIVNLVVSVIQATLAFFPFHHLPSGWSNAILSVPYLWWIVNAVQMGSVIAILLALATVLNRGIQPKNPSPPVPSN